MGDNLPLGLVDGTDLTLDNESLSDSFSLLLDEWESTGEGGFRVLESMDETQTGGDVSLESAPEKTSLPAGVSSAETLLEGLRSTGATRQEFELRVVFRQPLEVESV